ncbi:tetratricopeptide repeat protein, partial [Salegentibacter sp.]|uniref:tetratricopeptide repeat protein n=1 Tax=Salegentibacter sp. TaxID=1903072 RepID=UPI0035692865
MALRITGSCYEKEGNYLEALRQQENSLTIFNSLDDQNGVARVNENIGSIYEDLEQFEKAYYYFEKSYGYFKHTDDSAQISVLNNIGDVYRKTGKFEQAIVYSSEALNLAESLNELDEIESAHKDLSEIYYQTGEFQKAYDHLNRYDEIQNEIHSSESLLQLNTLQTTYDNREKEAEIVLLTKQNQINKANQKLLLGGTFTLILISGIFYYNLQRKRRDRNRV